MNQAPDAIFVRFIIDAAEAQRVATRGIGCRSPIFGMFVSLDFLAVRVAFNLISAGEVMRAICDISQILLDSCCENSFLRDFGITTCATPSSFFS